MTVFVAASDETSGATHNDTFVCGGFIAPHEDWGTFIVPWQERVLDGPPDVPYFHFKEWRKPEWRAQYGLSLDDAEQRIDAAIDLIVSLRGRAYWITQSQSGAAHWEHVKPLLRRREFSNRRVRAQLTDPYFDSAMGFVLNSLDWANEFWPECKQVQFRMGLRQGHELLLDEIRKIPELFTAHKEAHRARLFAGVESCHVANSHSSQNYLPAQAADLLLYLLQKKNAGTLDRRDNRRLDRLFSIEGLEHAKDKESTRQKGLRLARHVVGGDSTM